MLNLRDIDWESDALPMTLDRLGFLAAPGENRADFLSRVRSVLRARDALLRRQNDMESAVGFRTGTVVPMEEDGRSAAMDRTDRLYGLRADWVTAFYPEKGLGALWGGCAAETESGCPVFFLRKEFRERKRLLIYGKDELLAHELCHAVRGALNDPVPEELFAYRTSDSAFRRIAGDCFRSETDALLFLLPSIVLLLIQSLVTLNLLNVPVWPFWMAVALFPAFLVLRSVACRIVLRKAKRRLAAMGFCNADAVLFRMTFSEIKRLAKTSLLPDADLRSVVWNARFRKGEFHDDKASRTDRIP